MVEKSQALDSIPRRGRVVPELARFEITTYREILLRPYRLMYRIDGKRVSVVGFFDGRRNLEDVLLARLNRN